MKFTDVPIPIWMEKLPRDNRGYPIPVTVLLDKDGRPHFTVNEEHKRQQIIKRDACPICGRGLLTRRACVGGPKSLFHPAGACIDPPMHLECARYALQVCPYLAAPNYTKRIEGKTLGKGKEEVLAIDPTMDPNKPKLFCMSIHTKQKKILGHINGISFVRFIKPVQPYYGVEFWRDGKQLSHDEGISIVKKELYDVYEDDYQTLKENLDVE